MLDAGLIPGTVVDSYKATLWAPVLPRVAVHEDIALNEGGQIAWAMRQGSPQLKAVLDAFIIEEIRRREREAERVGYAVLA